VIWRLDGAIVESNEAFLRMVQYDREDVATGRVRWTDLTPTEWREHDERALAEIRATGTAQPYEKELFRKGGSRVPVLVAGTLFEEGGSEGVAFALDLSEQKEQEAERERLRQQLGHLEHLNRVSTMGELTASLAHEIKQPIGAAVTNAEACLQLIDRKQADVSEAREAALAMVKDARRAADIIDRVRSLYRRGSAHLEAVDVNEIIHEMIDMLRDEADRHFVTMHTDLAEGLPRVVADRVQLQQVLMNLALNGIEAMGVDTAGELSIKSQLAENSRPLISVTDTGVGLPNGKTDRIFDAFFTTKPQGTGLGLAIARSIVESHGGRIWATANSGRGATFCFTLQSTVA
jgi:PAS domain S-box-containing protein